MEYAAKQVQFAKPQMQNRGPRPGGYGQNQMGYRPPMQMGG